MKKTKLLAGVGVCDADYPVVRYQQLGYVDGKQKQKRVWACKLYECWSNMIRRCYSDSNPSYDNCIVVEEWHKFSNFRKWAIEQDWVGMCLDKDILSNGRKIYSPSTCVFIDSKTNNFMTDSKKVRGEFPIGVSKHKCTGKYKGRCGGKELGLFTTPEDAHDAWKIEKAKQAELLALSQNDYRVAYHIRRIYEV